MRRLLPLAALLALLPAAPATGAGSVVEVPLPASQLEALGFDVAHSGSAARPHVVLHDAADEARLARLTPSRVLVADVDRALAAARARDRAAARSSAVSAVPSGRVTYRSLSDYEADMDRLVAESPSLVRPADLPVRTIEGRTIRGVEIARDVGRVDDGRPTFVVASLHHAREWPSGEIAMEFAIDLVQRWEAEDARVRALLEAVRVVVIPVANPDGFVLSRTTEPLHRKNCRAVTPSEERLPCAGRSGVDPNRNYGALWGGPGASADPSHDAYRGTGPFSEPETQAIHQFSQGRQITGFEAIHNIAGQVLRQPGNYDFGDVSPDEAGLAALGKAMADATGYENLLSYELYPVHGATEDWNYIAQGAYAYTIELGPAAARPLFQGPYQTHVVDQYDGGGSGGPAGKGMREALLLEAENAADPAQHAILRATAPAGRVLRVRKTFQTQTSKVCLPGFTADDEGRTCSPSEPTPRLFDDAIDTTTVVPADGGVEWHVTPSTRPYVARDGGVEAWTLTCETPAGAVLGTRRVVVGRGQVAELGAVCDDADEGGGGGSTPTTAGAAGATGTSPTTGPGPSTGGGPLRLAAAADAVRRSTLLRRGVRVRVRCSPACTVRARILLGPRVVGTATRRVASSRRTTFRVRLSGAGRRMLRGRRPSSLRVRVSAATAGGRAASSVRRFRVGR